MFYINTILYIFLISLFINFSTTLLDFSNNNNNNNKHLNTKSKLQIGIKHRVQNCTQKTKKGDFLCVYYTVCIYCIIYLNYRV